MFQKRQFQKELPYFCLEVWLRNSGEVFCSLILPKKYRNLWIFSAIPDRLKISMSFKARRADTDLHMQKPLYIKKGNSYAED